MGKAEPLGQKSDEWLLGAWWGRDSLERTTREILEVMRVFYNLIIEMVYIDVGVCFIHRKVHLKWVNFIISISCLSKSKNMIGKSID